MLIAYFVTGILSAALVILRRRKNFSIWVSGLFLLVQITLSIWFMLNKGKALSGFFQADETAILFTLILDLIAALTFFHSINGLKWSSDAGHSIFYAGFIALLTSLTGVYASANLTVSWVFLEATTLSAAALVYYNRTLRALEATWKYIFISSIGIALAYVGILFVSLTLKHNASTSLSYTNLSTVLKSANPLYLKLAFLFVLTGYSAKMEIFPLYTIGIDANYLSPAPASALISSTVVNGGFVSILRLCQVYASTPAAQWTKHLLILTGFLSVLVAAIYMLRVKNYKRMLAYSTVEHMGLVTIGLGIGGAGTLAAILQVIMHSLAKPAMFFQFGQVHKVLKTYRIGKTGDYMNLNPAGALLILAGTITLMAIPPSGIFVPEWMLFSQMAIQGTWLLFGATALLLCVIIYGLAQRILPLLFSSNETGYSDLRRVNRMETFTQYILVLACMALCFTRPHLLYNWIGAISSSGLN